MEDSIKVSAAVLTETANTIRSINNSLDSSLENINKSMNDLEATWKSNAASEIRASMNALKPRFEEYKGIVESYAKFLMQTANTYEDTDKDIQNQASYFNL